MKTVHWRGFVLLGVLLVGSIGGMFANDKNLTHYLLIIPIAVIVLGYGLRLRQLAKKGVQDTKHPAA